MVHLFPIQVAHFIPILSDDVEAALKMYDSKSFTLAEIEMRTGVKRPTLYLYLNRRKNGEL